MSLVKTCPDIPDNWKGSVEEASKLLGLNRSTVYQYAKLGSRRGGIDCRMGLSGRMFVTGKELKRFWWRY